MKIFRKQSTKLWTVVVLGVAASILGILYAIFCGTAADGGRGGAVAVAIAFGALFTGTPSAKELLEAKDEDGKPKFDELSPEKQVPRLRTALADMLDGQRKQNSFLVWTSVIGTLVWAFGDVLAAALGAPATG